MAADILIFGATGMLGQALVREAAARGVSIVQAADRDAELSFDITDNAALAGAIAKIAPKIVINAAAITNLTVCEDNPGLAYAVNARAVSVMAESCRAAGARLVHISTDHFFTGDVDRLHGEDAEVSLLNEYARTKYAGERFALANRGALVLRTNITGMRGWAGQPTFFEWAVSALERRAPLKLFSNYFASTIDVGTFSRALFDLAGMEVSGLLNVASRDACSKEDFVRTTAAELDIELDWAESGAAENLSPPRAESLGLDVARAEKLLGYRLPTCRESVHNLAREYSERSERKERKVGL